MASYAISTGLEKLQETLNGSLEGQKLANLRKDMKDVTDPNNRITTDYGVKQFNTGKRSSLLRVLRPHSNVNNS
jgi:catalase